MCAKLLLALAIVGAAAAAQINGLKLLASTASLMPLSRVHRQPVPSYGSSRSQDYGYPVPYAAYTEAPQPQQTTPAETLIQESIPLQPDGLSKEVSFGAAEEVELRDLVPEFQTTEAVLVETTPATTVPTTTERMTTTTEQTTTTQTPTSTVAPLLLEEDSDVRNLEPETSEIPEVEIPEEIEKNLTPEVTPEKVVYFTNPPVNTTELTPAFAVYQAAKHDNYGYARSSFFPQSVVDASTNIWNSGRDAIGQISSFSYFRNDKSLDIEKPDNQQRFRNTVQEKFNRYMDDASGSVFDWETKPAVKEPPSGSAFISSPSDAPTPKKTYGVPKAAPYKYAAVPKKSYGVPLADVITNDAPPAGFRNAATLSDIIVPKRYILEPEGSSLPPTKSNI